jgi:hypothetical protein
VGDEEDDRSPWRERLELLRDVRRLALGRDLPRWKRVNTSLFLLALPALACMVIEGGISWSVIARAAQTDRVEWDGEQLLWHVILGTLPLTTWAFLWTILSLYLRTFPFLAFAFLGTPSLWLVTTLSYWLGFPRHSRSSRPSVWMTLWDGPEYLKANAHYYGLRLFAISLLCGLVLGVIGYAWRKRIHQPPTDSTSSRRSAMPLDRDA